MKVLVTHKFAVQLCRTGPARESAASLNPRHKTAGGGCFVRRSAKEHIHIKKQKRIIASDALKCNLVIKSDLYSTVEMFEAQVAYYLNRYLGQYVEGIDQRSLA